MSQMIAALKFSKLKNHRVEPKTSWKKDVNSMVSSAMERLVYININDVMWLHRIYFEVLNFTGSDISLVFFRM